MGSALKDFSLNDCNELLRKKLDNSEVTVNSYEFRPLDERNGFLGEHFFLKVEYSDENGQQRRTDFFAKAVPLDEIRYNFVLQCESFVKECGFYKDLVPEMVRSGVKIINDCIPTCYTISDNSDYLIFENLREKGYVTESPRTCLNLDTFKMGIDTLVKLHASGLILEEVMKVRGACRNYSLGEEYPELCKESFFPYTTANVGFTNAFRSGIETGINLFHEKYKLEQVELLKKLTFDVITNIREIVKPSTTYRNTICHSDLWSGNMMFKYENKNAVHGILVDFQTFRYGPPAQDLMSYLHLVVDREFRRQHTRDMLKYYYRKLSDALKDHDLCPEKVLSYDEFLESCAYYKVFARVLAANHFSVIAIPPDVLEELFESKKIEGVVFDDRVSVVDRCWRDDQFYRNKLCEVIEDLRDVFSETNEVRI